MLSSLNVIFKMALGLTTWDLSPAIVAEPLDHGGVQTFPLAVWVRYQYGQLFRVVLKDKHVYSGGWVAEFEEWSRKIGLSLSPAFFPYLQLSVVRLGS